MRAEGEDPEVGITGQLLHGSGGDWFVHPIEVPDTAP